MTELLYALLGAGIGVNATLATLLTAAVRREQRRHQRSADR